MRILFDTNVLVSAAFAIGKPKKLLLKALAGEFTLVTSDELLTELEKVIIRPKFEFSPFEIHRFLQTVRKTATIEKVKSDFKVVTEDPADNFVLDSAYDGKADYIVSGDGHLLKLKEFKGIKIVSVNQMLKLLKRR